eukprot:gene9170-10143_t
MSKSNNLYKRSMSLSLSTSIKKEEQQGQKDIENRRLQLKIDILDRHKEAWLKQHDVDTRRFLAKHPGMKKRHSVNGGISNSTNKSKDKIQSKEMSVHESPKIKHRMSYDQNMK